MKIEPNKTSVSRNSADRIDGKKLPEARNQPPENAVEQQDADQSILSDEAQIFSQALHKLVEIPEMREDIVNKLRTQIAQGKYQIHYEEIADILITNQIVK